MMLAYTKRTIIFAWNYIFHHQISPLRHIPDIATRHYVLQILGFMWAFSFSMAIGSYAFFAASIVGHSILIAAAALTISTWTAATKRPHIFAGLGRQANGEHQ